MAYILIKKTTVRGENGLSEEDIGSAVIKDFGDGREESAGIMLYPLLDLQFQGEQHSNVPTVDTASTCASKEP